MAGGETATARPRTLRAWFTGPPRAHGEVLDDRTVSFLELFYDLVFVVLIAQIAHTLAGDVSWTGVRDFVLVFLLIAIAWLNGTSYQELHGRDDGRTRSFVFQQMVLLALLAIYAAHAADEPGDGRGFAIVYALLLSLIAAQWWTLRRYDTPEMVRVVDRYVGGMVVMVVLVAASAVVPSQSWRLTLWGAAAVVFGVGSTLQIFRPDPERPDDGSFYVTPSMAERFGLFTIIVLGEVVVGVVDGLSGADRGAITVATGVVTLMVGFAFWWTYFDLVGGRRPRDGVSTMGLWNFGHLPVWLSIAAGGAGMVSLVEQADASRTSAPTAWLVAGAAAVFAVAVAGLVRTLPPTVGRRHAPSSLAAVAGTAVALGALRPSPLVLVLGLLTALTASWTFLFRQHALAGDPLGAD